jgi:hypothetical protein
MIAPAIEPDATIPIKTKIHHISSSLLLTYLLPAFGTEMESVEVHGNVRPAPFSAQTIACHFLAAAVTFEMYDLGHRIPSKKRAAAPCSENSGQVPTGN